MTTDPISSAGEPKPQADAVDNPEGASQITSEAQQTGAAESQDDLGAFTGAQEVRVENPLAHIWKMLRYFLDTEYASQRIKALHPCQDGESSKKHDQNVEKQARELAYSIRQAEEYFRASSDVGLATRPVLLYYGAVALSRTLVLLRQSGEYSADYLRKHEQHKHHGLDVVGDLGSAIREADTVEDFLRSLRCTVHEESGRPSGHFPLVYKSILVCPCRVEATLKARLPITGSSTYPAPGFAPLDSLGTRMLGAFDSLRTLPDMFIHLLALGILPDLRRVEVSKKSYLDPDNSSGDTERPIARDVFTLGLHCQSAEEREALVLSFKEKHPRIVIVAEDGPGAIVRFSIDYRSIPKGHPIWLPDLVDDLNDNKFLILRPDQYLPETASMLAILFCLGMLARYYPDRWMKVIDRKVQVAELTDAFLNVVHRKYPGLILDQLTGIKRYVHT